MKVDRIHIRNFKRFQDLDASFRNDAVDAPVGRRLVLGDNGSGKTTFLQAVALPLALATKQIRDLEDFDWSGFVAGRHFRWGPPQIEVDVLFTPEELTATQEAALRWDESRSAVDRLERPLILPGNSPRVRLHLDGASCRANTPEEYFQFSGRYYARQLLKRDASVRSLFRSLPGAFWFDQYRNLSAGYLRSPQHLQGGNGSSDVDAGMSQSRVAQVVGVEQLRKHLTGWWIAQQYRPADDPNNWLTRLESLYQQAFPGRSFAGLEPMPGAAAPSSDDYYFLLTDGNRTYDLAEMSAGEQAIFPILFEFTRLSIANSVVLIDEVDLNLHPPAAQRLIRLLPRLGGDCQFVLTTHSDAVSEVIGPHDTYRLPGGALCL